MNPTTFNFSPVERGQYHFGKRLEDNTLVMGKKTMAIAYNLLPRFDDVQLEAKRVYARFSVGLGVDVENKAIKLTPGGTFVARRNALQRGNNSAMINIPKALANLNLPKGIYKMVDEENLVFVHE